MRGGAAKLEKQGGFVSRALWTWVWWLVACSVSLMIDYHNPMVIWGPRPLLPEFLRQNTAVLAFETRGDKEVEGQGRICLPCCPGGKRCCFQKLCGELLLCVSRGPTAEVLR